MNFFASLLLLLSLVLVSANAAADAIGPGPAPPSCPDGARRVNLGAGHKSCAPATCENDGDCRADHKECREVALCIGLTNRAGSSELSEEEVFAGKAPSCPSGSRSTTKKVCTASAPIALPGSESQTTGDAAPPPVRASGCGACASAPSGESAGGLLAGLGIAVALGARRRRSR